MNFRELRNRLISSLWDYIGCPVILSNQVQPEAEPPFCIYTVTVPYIPDAKKHPSGGEEDPRPNEDYEWMYMLVDSVTIPERSFIRASFDTGKATLENICKEAVDGIILKKWTAQEAADYIGKWAVEMTHDYFNTKLSPPKSATTQLTSTQYQPLFDTGRLYNSISYSVEGI